MKKTHIITEKPKISCLKNGEVEGIGKYGLYKKTEIDEIIYYAIIYAIYPYPQGFYNAKEMKEMLENEEIAEKSIRDLWSEWLTVFYDD